MKISARNTTLRDRGLGDRVTIQTTGCLKICSQAPNLILKPGNIRLKNMNEITITALLNSIMTSSSIANE